MDFFAFMADAQSLAQQQLSQQVDDAGPMVNTASAELYPANNGAGQPGQVAQPAGVSAASAEAKPPEHTAEKPKTASDEFAGPVDSRAADKAAKQTAAGEKERTEAAQTAQTVAAQESGQQRSDKTTGDETVRTAKEAGRELVTRREMAGEARERLAQLARDMKKESGRTKKAGPELEQNADQTAVALQQSQETAVKRTVGVQQRRVDRIQPVAATETSVTPIVADRKPVISPVKTQVRPVAERSAVGDPAAAPIQAAAATAAPAGTAAHKVLALADRRKPVEATSATLERGAKAAGLPVAVFALPQTPVKQLYRNDGGRHMQGEGAAKQEAKASPAPRISISDRRTAAAADIPQPVAVKPEAVRPAAFASALTAAAVAGETRPAPKAAGGGGPRVEAAAKAANGGEAAAPAHDATRGTATLTAKAVTAPAAVNRAEIAQQLQDLVREARFTLTDNKTEVSMQLKPEALGRVRLQMAIEGDTVSGRLITETTAAKQALEEHLPEMLKQFETQGLTVGSFSVEVRQQPQPAPDPSGNGDGGRSGSRQDSGETTDPRDDDPGPQWYRHSDSRVEYIV